MSRVEGLGLWVQGFSFEGFRAWLQVQPRGRGTIGLPNPKALRTHILWLLGPKTVLYKAFGLF